MPARLRSIFNRLPDPVPPPVVCRTEPEPSVNAGGDLEVRRIEDGYRWNPAGYVLTCIGLLFRSLPEWAGEHCTLVGEFWSDGLVPTQPIDPQNDQPLPMPFPPIQAVTVTRDQEILVWIAKTHYDDVVLFTLMSPDVVHYHLYVDMGRLKRKEFPNHG